MTLLKTADGVPATVFSDLDARLDVLEAAAAASSQRVSTFPVESYGAVAGANITTALLTAVAAAVAGGGGLVTMNTAGNAARYSFTGQIDIPDRVGLWGSGPRSTYLQATSAGSYLNFEGFGPVSGNFSLTGAAVADKAMRVGLLDQRTFIALDLSNADDLLVLDGSQNCSFIGFKGIVCNRGIVFDNGASGNAFVGHTEVASFKDWAVVFQHTGALADPFTYPKLNTFYGGMLEHVTAPKAVTGVASTDILTSAAHGFQLDQRVAFRTLTGGIGLSVGTSYYVISSTTNTFQLSATLGGAAINFTTDLTAGTIGAAIRGVVLDEAGGVFNAFNNVLFSASGAVAPCALVESHDPGGYGDKRLRFSDCDFQGDLASAYVTAFDLGNSTNVEIGGRCTFADLNRRFYMTDDSRARIENEPLLVNNAGTYFTSNGGSKVASEVIRWENALSEDLPGIMTPSGSLYSIGVTTVLLVAGRGYFNRFKLDRTTVLSLIAYTVTTAALSNDNVEVAIFDSTGARLQTSGAVAGKLNATGVQTVPLARTLDPGVYYVGLLCPTVGSTAATLIAASAGSLEVHKMFGATAPKMTGCHQNSLASLPNPIVPTFSASTLVALGLRES